MGEEDEWHVIATTCEKEALADEKDETDNEHDGMDNLANEILETPLTMHHHTGNRKKKLSLFLKATMKLPWWVYGAAGRAALIALAPPIVHKTTCVIGVISATYYMVSLYKYCDAFCCD
jgi:hypothetical protein